MMKIKDDDDDDDHDGIFFLLDCFSLLLLLLSLSTSPKHQDLHHAFPNAVGALSQRGRFHGWEKVHDAAVDVLSRGLFLPQGEGNQDWTGGPVDGWL